MFIFLSFFSFLILLKVTVSSDHPIHIATLCFLNTLQAVSIIFAVIWSATSSNRGIVKFFWASLHLEHGNLWLIPGAFFTATCQPSDTQSIWQYMYFYAVDGLLRSCNALWDYNIFFRQLLYLFSACLWLLPVANNRYFTNLSVLHRHW